MTIYAYFMLFVGCVVVHLTYEPVRQAAEQRRARTDRLGGAR